MLCPRCQQKIPDFSTACGLCGATFGGPPPVIQNPYSPPYGYAPPQSLGDDAALRMLLPVGRSVWAIIAGYLGLFSLFFCFLGPFAVLAGIGAIIDLQRNPKLHGMPRAIFGIVLGILSSAALVFVIVMLAFGK